MTPQEQHNLEQNGAGVFPPFWRRLFVGLIEQGFSEQQSFAILLTYITARRTDNA